MIDMINIFLYWGGEIRRLPAYIFFHASGDNLMEIILLEGVRRLHVYILYQNMYIEGDVKKLFDNHNLNHTVNN